MTSSREELAAAIGSLRAQQKAAVQWMLRHIGPDGHPGGAAQLNSWYRLPWALAVAGERPAAAAVLSWIECNALSPQGDLLPGPARKPNPPYALAQIAIGAAHLERYDTAHRVMDTLATYMDPESGGCYTEPPESRTTFRQDILLTGQMGLAALFLGRADMARAAAGWFLRLLEAQPGLPKRLYNCWTPKGLLTDVPSGMGWACITDFHQPRQQFYNPGIAAAFLGRYHQATGDSAALAAARRYLDLNVQGDALQWDGSTVQICKFAWGASVLLEVTGEDAYREHLMRMTRWYADMQDAGGNWHPSPFQAEHPTVADDMPKTAEHTLHVTTMLTALGRSAALQA